MTTISIICYSQHAYHPGNSPVETEGTLYSIQPYVSFYILTYLVANIASIKETLQVIADIMRHSGVGALPLLPMPTSLDVPFVPPTEQQLMIDTNQSIQTLYEKLKRSQESAAVVANLLTTADQSSARSSRP
jgi:hypothetical protein